MKSPVSPLGTVLLWALAASLSLAPHAAQAQENNPVTVNLTARKVVVKNGKETLASADKAKPGDVIQYAAVYLNSGSTPVQGLQATVPIPEGLTFVAGSAKLEGAQASLDGKIFQPMPLMREVKNVGGINIKQAVPLVEYRALRWSVEQLEAGKSVTVQLRAEVRTNPPAR